MPLRLDARQPGFAAAFANLLAARQAVEADVSAAVAAIIGDVRARGDAAVIDYTNRFDRVALAAGNLRIPESEIAAAVTRIDRATLAALEQAAARIRAFHERQRPADERHVDAEGVELGWRWTPEELLTTGDRLFQLKRLVNLRLGVTAADDTLPQRLLTQARPDGHAAGVLPDLAPMLRAYYDLRDWDESGAPRRARLERLGIV